MSITETFDKLTNLQKILVIAILATILYSASTAISYSLFSRFRPSGELVTSLPGPATPVEENPKEPKTEECPLDGDKHTKKAKAAWEKRRPLAVMIENHSEARPQSGLTSADIIYEAVAEGGITRLMAIFYCHLADIQVGPIRSARTYFLDWLSEYDSLYAHVGGANTPGSADALGQIIKYRIKSLNQFGIGFPTYWRDYQRLGHSVATEHTMYSTTQKLWEVAVKRGWANTDEEGTSWDKQSLPSSGGERKNFTPWKFNGLTGSPLRFAGQVTNIKVSFWQNQPNYDVDWIYDSSSGVYKRKNGGENQIDLNNQKQIEAKNVVVQLMRESNANDGYENNIHLLYKTIGNGRALIFMDGKVIEGKWVKDLRTSRTKYLDAQGLEVVFNRGQIWIQTVPEGAKIVY